MKRSGIPQSVTEFHLGISKNSNLPSKNLTSSYHKMNKRKFKQILRIQ